MLKNKYVENIVLISSIILTVLLIFNYSFSKLILTWVNSNTYGHGFLILPIVLWLINEKRQQLSLLQTRTSKSALWFVGLFSILWFISVLTYVNVAEQFVLFTLFIILTWAFFGKKIVLALKFPLAFLYFSIPIGDFLIPYLQFITADISVYLIQLLGIPVFRDGMYIQIPNGNFLVAEACSGIRFLISTVTMGVLFAYLSFTQLYKKILFVLLCFVVAIVGNGLRAFLMILIGHLSDMKAAVGFDHLVYGWVFFSIILVILFIIGSYMADSDEKTPEITNTDKNKATNQIFPSITFIFLAIVLLLVGPILKYKYDQYLLKVEHSNTTNTKHNKKIVQQLAQQKWQPSYPDADYINSIEFKDSQINVFFAKYFYETDTKEIISYKNQLFDLNKWSLKSISSGEVQSKNGKFIPYTSYAIVNLKGRERELRVTYKVSNTLVANKIYFKFLQLINKMMMVDFGGEVIIVSTMNKGSAVQQLDQFMSQHFQKIISTTIIDK